MLSGTSFITTTNPYFFRTTHLFIDSGLFEESKALLEEFIAFDQEHQLSQKVGAQLWRLTKAVGKPALMLSFKGIQSAIVTIANPEKRAALIERFNRSELAKDKGASLSPVDD